MHCRYELIVTHNPMRFWRRWRVDVDHVTTDSHRPGLMTKRHSLPDSRHAFTKQGALRAGMGVADEHRRLRVALANAEVVKIP